MGTGYTASLLKANGFDVLHEKNGKDGMISWLACSDRDDQPWGEPPKYDHTVNFIVARSPLKAIISIIAENNNWESLLWRQLSIKDKLGIDIFDNQVVSQDAVGLAVASLHYWYQICLSMDHEFIYRVDVLSDNDLLSKLLGKDIVKEKDIHKNAHPERYANYSYTEKDLDSLSEEWKLRLAELCEILGYPKESDKVLDML